MKINYADLKDRTNILQSLTGFNTSEFKALLPSFGAAWASFDADTFVREGRKRAGGAGRKAD